MTSPTAPPVNGAFGVEPGYHPYRLRQARYQALGEAVAAYLAERGHALAVPKLLDVGLGRGRSRRYIEVQPNTGGIRYCGVDRFSHGRSYVYQHQDWMLAKANLETGLPFMSAGAFDIVLCEQVLEHLQNPRPLLGDLGRVLAPGGLLIVGVPIFPPGLAPVRAVLVRLLDCLLPPKKPRDHIQSFSLASFRGLLDRLPGLEISEVRGFRILSGGPLRFLEHFRWWWRLNRFLGALLPAWCTEVQALVRRPAPDRSSVHAAMSS